MTDTGQIPGEDFPGNAGAVPQQGSVPGTTHAPRRGEDELLMPSAQGAWGEYPASEWSTGQFPADDGQQHATGQYATGHEQPYAADPQQYAAEGQPYATGQAPEAEPQPPYTEAPEPQNHEAGAHERAGRDSGAVDVSAVRAAEAARTPPPRRPLHMGPPVPGGTSGSQVRSLADRGPAAHPAPARQTGPAPTGPEYLDQPDPATLPGPQLGALPETDPAWTGGQDASWSTGQHASYGDAAPVGPAYAPDHSGHPPLPAQPEAAAQDTAQAPHTEARPFPEAPDASAATHRDASGMPEYVPAGQDAAAAPVELPGQRTGAAPDAEATAPVEPQEAPVAENPAAEPGQPPADASLGQFVAVAGAVPTDGHLAPAETLPEWGTPPAGAPVEAVAEAASAPARVEVAAETVAAPEEAAPEQAAPEAPEAEEPQAQAAVETAAVPVPEVAEQAPAADETVAEAPAEAQLPAEAPVPAETVPEAAEPQDAEPEAVAPESGAEPVAAEPVAVEAVEAGSPEEAPAPDQEAVPEEEAPAELPREEPRPAAPGYAEAERDAVLRVMRERRDIRNGFRSDPIPHDVLLRVLEAAHTAPSVGHSQPWDFVVIRSADTRQAMHELAERQREAYATSLPKGRAKQFKELKIEAILDTPVNIVVTADPTRGGRHTLGRHTQPQMAPYSSALAVENLWLAARAEGLGVGWVSFFDEREMVRELGLPDHLEVVAYLCVGYVDEFPEEPELMQAGWSKRRPLSWVVHEETYGRRALPGEEPHDLLAETVANIRPLDAKALGEAWERQKRMTKPAGALGMLEIISAQLSGLSRKCPPPVPEPAAVAVFAGDHGVHAQGVTPWPQEVTGQMVANFLGGGAVCNAFAAQVGAEVCVVDVGVATELPATPGLLPRKVRPGTADMTAGPALTREEVKAAIEVGIETARDLVAAGNKALLTGEMGIANTTASAALISVYTGADPAEVTGRGTGINDETLARKTDVVRRALELHRPDPADPIGVLAAVGGLEHAAMAGLLLGGASLRTPVILDGVSAGAAALVARAIAPEVLAACIAGHRSAEPGHVAALNKLGLRPLVDLDLRLGEGTGALLALPIVQSAARAMHEVATFDSAGVTEK
ncbi:5,6-dimethylbenzimidazole synthase [Streptomyces sp. CS227]|uniref:nicotinate-nucleotide--dimethylbenzimidazole phosphoribosyltransferase n=1 Tax=Streptomyces sp. CS227 TaxID=1982763 RepID=UPI000B414F62|nr:nicotinate-nucleotide--dimethylbenzimidazole phosphoribosyltransferase [Streptomyces sp. CS227]OWA04834.1 5,6-dimethylbenzimidazole synthase [Streptomyces sp. CS227]